MIDMFVRDNSAPGLSVSYGYFVWLRMAPPEAPRIHVASRFRASSFSDTENEL